MTDIESIIAGNARIVSDKAWETSWTRKLFIASITYVVVALYLPLPGIETGYFHAFIPICGEHIATLSIPFVKQW